MADQHTATDRVAVVTGASQGIGLAVADRLVHSGYTVWTAARRGELLAELAAQHPAGAMLAAPTDLTHPAEVDNLISRIRHHTPIVHALIHSAGTYSHGTLGQTPTEQLTENYAVNVESAYRLTQGMLGLMSGPGDVIFFNSSQGLHAAPAVSQYASSMHARKAVADALRAEINSSGIRVTSLFLGRTATPLQEMIYAEHGWEYRPELLLQPADVAAMVCTIVSMPRTAEITDMTMRPAIRSY